MKQLLDKEELSSMLMSLSRVNRDYILAIARALTFAQNKSKDSPPEPDEESKKS